MVVRLGGARVQLGGLPAVAHRLESLVGGFRLIEVGADLAGLGGAAAGGGRSVGPGHRGRAGSVMRIMRNRDENGETVMRMARNRDVNPGNQCETAP